MRAGLERVSGLFPRLAAKRAIPVGLLSGGDRPGADGAAPAARPRRALHGARARGGVHGGGRDRPGARWPEPGGGLTLPVAEQNVRLPLRPAHYAAVLENGRGVRAGSAPDCGHGTP
ncbi:hypothetical protein ACRAWG_27025 [Methylobacterium sp. P31]